jgi:hypothetical protein
VADPARYAEAPVPRQHFLVDFIPNVLLAGFLA